MLFRNREERRAERMEKRIAKEKLRAEEDIIESLIKGVEKTNWISHETQANNEIYRLDVMATVLIHNHEHVQQSCLHQIHIRQFL